MKEKELREVANCYKCKKPFGGAGPMFYRVRVETYILNVAAASRQQGLTMAMGGHAALAMIMGPDEDLAERITSKEVTLCLDCAVLDGVLVGELIDEPEV